MAAVRRTLPNFEVLVDEKDRVAVLVLAEVDRYDPASVAHERRDGAHVAVATLVAQRSEQDLHRERVVPDVGRRRAAAARRAPGAATRAPGAATARRGRAGGRLVASGPGDPTPARLAAAGAQAGTAPPSGRCLIRGWPSRCRRRCQRPPRCRRPTR
jgi:hypothetical protein